MTELGDLAGELAVAALAMARRFAAGGTLWCLAPDLPAHAHHLAVEFVHPVIVGKRALPAVTVPGTDPVGVLGVLARPGDVVIAVAGAGDDRVAHAMRLAPASGLTTVWIGAGAAQPAPGAADHVLWLDGEDMAGVYTGRVVLLYHLLWELTHVCFEHEARLPEVGPDATDFLYPFIDGDERDGSSLLAGLSRSAEAKAAESAVLRDATLARVRPALDETAAAMASRFAAGGRLFTFGNGGSSTDAELTAAMFVCPPDGGRPLPARSLTTDPATLTALGNDVGFELVFSRQLAAAAGEPDIALAISTSGNSANLIRALTGARRRGLLTVGLAGYDGGHMAAGGDLDHCLVVTADSVHRIQEVQAALLYELWSAVQARVVAVAR